MATDSIGTARVDVVVDTSQFDTAIQAAKRSVSDMSTSAQAAYNQLDAREKRRVDRLIHQANQIGFTREQQIAYNAALKTQGPILDEITRKLALNNNQVQRAGVELNRYGVSAKQQAAALRGVPAQMTDIFIGLQGGQNPLTVLLQQGGQLKDMFGGVVPAARALGGAVMGLVNPFTVSAAAIATFLIALEQGRDQAREFEKAILLTGNVAGTSAEELGEFAKQLDGLTGVTQREASAVLAEVASTGQFTADQILQVASAALQMREATGREISSTIAEFAKLKKEPAEAIAALSLAVGDGTQAVNFLTREQYENIRSLQEQGRETEAAQAAFDAYAGAIETRAPQITAQVGALEAAFRGAKNGAGELWDEFVQGMNEAANELERQSIGPFGNFLRYFGRRGRGVAAPAAEAAGTPLTAEERNQIDEAAKARKKAEEEFSRLELSNLSKKEKLEREIKDIRELGLKAGKSEAEIEKQIAQARARYAESLPKGRKARTETDPTDAILARVRQQIALNEEQARSEETLTASERLRIQVLQQIEELGAKVTPQRKAEIEALLETAVATDKLVQAKKAEAQASKDLAALNSQLTVAEQNYRRQAEADLASIGRGSEAVEMLRRQLDLQRELEDGLDSIRRDSAGKSKEALEAEEQALRDSIDRRLETEREYQQQRIELQADWRNGMNAAIEDFMSNARDVAGSTYDFVDGTLNGLADATARYATGTKDAFGDLLDDIYAQSVRFLAQQAINELIKAFGGGGGSAGSSDSNMAGGLLDLLGSSGGWGWSKGGYTGDGGVNEPAGIVHRGEYVLNQNATRAMGRSVLDRINAGQGGAVAGSTMHFSQVNYFDRNNSQATPEQLQVRTGQEIQRQLARTGG